MDHFVIRFAEPRDGAALAAVYAPFVEGDPTSFEERAPDDEEMSGRIERGRTFAPWLVADDAGTIAGYAYAAPHRSRAAYRWSCETSVFVDPTFQRRGVARALYSRLLALLKLQGFVQAYAGIALPNDGSVGLHEALGFESVALYRDVGFKAGAWRDVGWWARPLYAAAPVPPPTRLSPADLDGTREWSASVAD